MQYRYAVMPLLLTVRDFQELLIRDLTELRSYTGYVRSKIKVKEFYDPNSGGWIPRYLENTDRTAIS